MFDKTNLVLGQYVEPQTKTVQCFAQLSPSERKTFVENMYVETEIVTCYREAPAIPIEARKQEGRIILRKTPVQVGFFMEEFAEIMDVVLTVGRLFPFCLIVLGKAITYINSIIFRSGFSLYH